MGFLKPFLVLAGLLTVAAILTPIIAIPAMGIFLIMILDNSTHRPSQPVTDPYEDA